MPDAERAKNSGRGKNGSLTLIRQFCLECQGASAKAVRACGDEACPLWVWRLAVLAGHQHDDLAEPEQRIEGAALAQGGHGPHGVQFERMDQ